MVMITTIIMGRGGGGWRGGGLEVKFPRAVQGKVVVVVAVVVVVVACGMCES